MANSIVSNSTDDKVDSTGWSANLYQKNASFVYSPLFTAPVLQILNAQPGERILDLGCGTGEVTLEIEKLVKVREEGLVVGSDFSNSMLEQARRNGLEHTFQCDAQNLELPPNITEKFDAVFSNAALHWCKTNPAGVILGVKKVLKPGGRFAAEMGGFMNCIGVRSALREELRKRGINPDETDPWYFPSVEDYTKLLVSGGFAPTEISLNPRVTPLPTGLYGWMSTFVRNSLLCNLPDDEAEEIMRSVEEKMKIDCCDASGSWAMMYVRLRFSAVLTEQRE